MPRPGLDGAVTVGLCFADDRAVPVDLDIGDAVVVDKAADDRPQLVQSAPSPLPDAASPAEPAKCRPTLVEIALGNGRRMKVYEDIDPAVLARLASALDGGKR